MFLEGKVFLCPVQSCNLWRILLIKCVLLLSDYVQDGWCHPLEERIWLWAWKIKYKYIFLPSHLCITLLSCCRIVIYDKVTGEANSAWKAATVTESKRETEKEKEKGKKTLGSRLVSWEGTGIRGWTVKGQNHFMVKPEYLGPKFQAFTGPFYTYSHVCNTEESLYLKYTSTIGAVGEFKHHALMTWLPVQTTMKAAFPPSPWI